ncbi:hypothetical protein P3X46_020646 [Hevea brasiliensis]|uniref:F-box domain-containing protein n=1 Tax=Hevea brasiliensis TaxID=3981 RepID=A0ABQ9LNS7_HEVBR|nr:uncharacterized protein LOC110654488 [Hevea brasiliensis]KAJ9169185.1 hypothetical protein P3X46_020646 [Hevea brasiliensis]
MKKLYRRGTVHPSPPIISDYLSSLPATILTLTAALSLEDREVLAYLISCSSTSSNFSNHSRITQKSTFYNKNSSNDHPPFFNCNCFSCYMSYWIRWDSSPNRQLIHEIIDAFEDGLLAQGKSNNKKHKKRKGNNGSIEQKLSELNLKKLGESDSVGESSSGSGGGDEDGVGGDQGEGSVRRFVSFIGERIWGVLA